jgi:hypothetical protein
LTAAAVEPDALRRCHESSAIRRRRSSARSSRSPEDEANAVRIANGSDNCGLRAQSGRTIRAASTSSPRPAGTQHQLL